MKKAAVNLIIVLTLIFGIFSMPASAETDVIVLFSRSSINLYVGQIYKLTLSDTSTATELSSSDESVAVVDDSMVVTAVSVGTAIITASFSNGYSTQCTVEVIDGDSPEEVTLSFRNIAMIVGESEKLEAAVYPEDTSDKSVYYSSSDTSIAYVDDDGYINAAAVGTAVISVEAASSAVAEKCIVRVSQEYDDTDSAVSISGTLYTLAGKAEENITVEIKNSSEAYTTITDSNGQFSFEGIGSGSYIVSLYEDESSSEAYASTQISVGSYNMDMTCIVNKSEIVVLYQDQQYTSEDIEDITLEVSSLILDIGEQYDMEVTVRPSDITNPALIITSSDESVAVVNSDGTIEAVSEGSATIVFSTIDEKISKSCFVTVTNTNSNTYSWVIILIEAVIIAAIVIVFTVNYRKFLKQKEREEM